MESVSTAVQCRSSSTKANIGTMMRKLVLSVLLFAFLGHNQVKSQDEQNEPQISVSYNISDNTAMFTCTVPNLGRRRIMWSKLSEPYPISVGTTRFTPDKKYAVKIHDKDTYILIINDLNLDDGGEYQCRVTGLIYIASVLTLNIREEGESNTYLLPTNITVKAKLGSTAVMPCEVENLNNRLVLWKNFKNDIISLRKKVFFGDRRFKIIHNTRPQWSLRLKDVKEYDYGHYTCVINSHPTILTRTVELVNPDPVKMAPVLIKDAKYFPSLEVDSGATVTLTCNFKANPKPKIIWYKRVELDGKRVKIDLNAKGSTFTMMDVKPKQSATYYCQARNGVKPPGRGKTKLVVKAPPTTTTPRPTTFIPDSPIAPHIFVDDKLVAGKRGRNVELKCLAIGQPRPQIHWTRHHARLTNDHKYALSELVTGRYALNSTLLIRSITSRDYGDYKCIALNRIGLLKDDVELYDPSQKP